MATAFFSRGRPAVAAALHTAERHSAHNDLTACRVRFAYGLRLLRDLRPLRHSGHTHAPTPTADYPPRASHFPGRQRKQQVANASKDTLLKPSPPDHASFWAY